MYLDLVSRQGTLPLQLVLFNNGVHFTNPLDNTKKNIFLDCYDTYIPFFFTDQPESNGFRTGQ